MYIKRAVEKNIKEGARYFPVVAILGPRQSGKTTLAKRMFAKHVYVSLEDSDVRAAAISDPRTFLEHHRNEYGVIIDEFQYAPDLLSYIQTIVDAEQRQGFFILTGSQNFLMNRAISQSLVGRVSIHTLLQFSVDELAAHKMLVNKVEQVLYQGLYPATYTKKTPHRLLYSQYVQTYLERDVRQLTNVGDLSAFQTFLILCAERVGQLVNYTEIGNACRISDQTVRRWLSVLEASYIVYLLRPYAKTMGARYVKSPKLYFYDSGLACYLLKIKQDELITHPKCGSIFESFIIAEIIKHFYNKSETPTIYFWRDRDEHEVDCIIQHGLRLIALEIKSGRTPNANFFSGLSYWKKLTKKTDVESYVVYAGPSTRISGYKELISWQLLGKIMKFLG